MAAREDGDLKALIRRDIPEKRKKPSLRKGDWLRVSGLAMTCPREEVLCARDDIVRNDNIDADLMLIFEHGHGLHWDLQNRVLPLTKTLYGRWLCGACGAYHGGKDHWTVGNELFSPDKFSKAQVLRPAQCPHCHAPMNSDNSLYIEQHVKDPLYHLMGHPDGFLRLDGFPGLGVLEVKSISPRGAYEVRNCAKLDHVTQAQCYMWMTGCRWGKVVYWDKGTVGMRGIIEHTIEYDEDHVEAIQNVVRSIWSGIEGGKLPERICASPDCKRAEGCAAAATCFQEAA
jgi:hypothetical protein